MQEYSRTMILTDADGDGYANEFIINRSFCYPRRPGPGVDSNQPELGAYDRNVKRFCHTRPVGTPAIYSFDNTNQIMKEISKSYENFWAGDKFTNPCCLNGANDGINDCNALSMTSGDFDNDQIADHVVLYKSKMTFFFSSDRKRGALPESSADIGLEIKLPTYCEAGISLQLVDIDNDGKEELLVKCTNVGVYLLYSRGLSKLSWTLNNGCNGKAALGDMSNRFNELPTVAEMKEFCQQFANQQSWGMKDKICDNFNDDERRDFTKSDGLSIVDVNNDGFRDIVSITDFGHLRFYINTPTATTRNNKFISFRLIGDMIGSGCNYYGIGATLILFSQNKSTKSIYKQFREISSAQHHTDFYGSKDDRIVFGLGKRLQPKKLIVRWPTGFKQLIKLHDWSFSKKLSPIDISDIKSEYKRIADVIFPNTFDIL